MKTGSYFMECFNFKTYFNFKAIYIRVLKKPRRIMLMVKAGQPVDAMISNILPFLDKDDIIIDGGNSEYTDTSVSFLCICFLSLTDLLN